MPSGNLQARPEDRAPPHAVTVDLGPRLCSPIFALAARLVIATFSRMAKQYWLVKQEPESYSWSDFVRDDGTQWTGIRNYQARLNLRAMKLGDLVFFYHSVTEKQVVGVAKVAKEHFPDPTAKEGDWSAVDLKPVKPLKRSVALDQIKKDKALVDMVLVRNSRLSTQAVTEAQAKRLLELGETKI